MRACYPVIGAMPLGCLTLPIVPPLVVRFCDTESQIRKVDMAPSISFMLPHATVIGKRDTCENRTPSPQEFIPALAETQPGCQRKGGENGLRRARSTAFGPSSCRGELDQVSRADPRTGLQTGPDCRIPNHVSAGCLASRSQRSEICPGGTSGLAWRIAAATRPMNIG